MKCQADIVQSANQKLQEAECLLQHGFFAGAYYSSGYVIELLLKARVCKTLGIDDFFDFGSPSKTKIKNEGMVAKPYKVHDFEQLIVLSGIYGLFLLQLSSDQMFKANWSIVTQWNEDARYSLGKTEQDTKDFVTSIKEVAAWIRKHL